MVTIPTKPTLTCNLGYYPIAVVAVKGGLPLQIATVKFESWALVLGKQVGLQTATRTTNTLGLAQICFLYRMYGKISIMHKNNDFGSGVGKYHTIANITSLQSPKFYRADVVIPTPTPYVPPITLSPLPIIPGLPTPSEEAAKKAIEDAKIAADIAAQKATDAADLAAMRAADAAEKAAASANLPTGRIGSVIRLTVDNFFRNKPTFVEGRFWGCGGASKTKADIIDVLLPDRTIEKQGIKVGQTGKFKSGFAVKVNKISLSERDTFADVIITKSITIAPPITPPTPIAPPTPVTPPTPVVPDVVHQRITRILSDGQDLPKANKGETVKITAESYCVINGNIDKSSVPSILLVDGVVADKKPVVGGLVLYEWVATAIPSRHTICVQINPTDSCKAIGKDCKKISVSPTELDISEQLLRERLSSSEQRELIKQSRTSLREELLSATRDVPSYEAPAVSLIPATSILPTVIPATQPVAPETGSIKLTGIPITVPDDIDAYIYVDDVNKGIINTVPMTLTSIPVGSHSVYVVDGIFKSMTKNVTVTANETSTVSLL